MRLEAYLNFLIGQTDVVEQKIQWGSDQKVSLLLLEVRLFSLAWCLLLSCDFLFCLVTVIRYTCPLVSTFALLMRSL